MKALSALFTCLLACSSAAFADTDVLTAQALCEQARTQYQSKDIPSADLSISFAKELADANAEPLPAWCKKHYQQVRMSGLVYSLQKFDAGYGNDWNSAWNQIFWIEHSAKELGVTLAPTYYAKATVVKARNEEIRRYFISLCKPEDKCILRD